MARIVLVTGGCRSGKSAHAQKMAEGLPGRRAFVATCPPVDDEMRARIRRHREARERSEWHTIEEEIDLPGVVRGAQGFDVLLIDCLTLWVNNLMYEAERAGRQVEEAEVERRCRDLLSACAERPGTVIFVTNEVGMGIVPDNPASRRFRDLIGRCNQVVGAAADEVTLLVCGIPVKVK
ncbi:MAG: bifunctional adenosylcobinamide kinase/adenosylcobinamide-phosphate guanylyltransferase [Candidatus Handelsmanbacteria bacterium RIFCSPLOWO2_12_FULL_64_10]|uniref:Adenosylcobinamide kinase n=1 Tax=Handelsmanbacteria sp. (strain RIFCSPLOWO2_12_FULL_64_10) TaxID=1817868 RepID=A0A1F6CJR7_HANXR|nr:MAG: bifunctional adenosylcobinamide kinase/adenosylcobinamide-phosphate guanylyltransferase [Candidatus Handelsmanbacteria bacterium RIFCSPLOWO2_12_FULL_64_10]